MEIIYFTVAAIVLYAVSDRVLDRVEIARGRRFEYRSVIFFFILLALALLAFGGFRYLLGG